MSAEPHRYGHRPTYARPGAAERAAAIAEARAKIRAAQARARMTEPHLTTGPCAGCGAPTTRYGDAGGSLCQSCGLVERAVPTEAPTTDNPEGTAP